MKSFLPLFFAVCLLIPVAEAQTRVIYHPEGTVKAEITKLKNGLAKVQRYTSEGQLYETGYYRYNKRHGQWQSFNEHGEIVTNAYFFDDKKEGIWTIKDAYSGVQHIVYFNNNRLLRMETESLGMLSR
ncbi:MAG: hypothetical protein KDC37_03545 [Flavobacteriales bacterium]|nr:hypothetical protein [Flavobacteriales bacterium]